MANSGKPVQTRRERLDALKAQTRKKKKQGSFLENLSSTAWTGIITGIIVIGIVIFVINVNIGAKSTTNGSGDTIGTLTNQSWLVAGKKAPVIGTLKDATNGATLDVSKIIGNGKDAVLLELYAPWCPHCQHMTTILDQLQATYQSKGVQILAVSASSYGHNYESGDQSSISYSDIAWFHDTLHTTYPLLYDPSMKVGNAYGLYQNGYPTYYCINKSGMITSVSGGDQTYAALTTLITQAQGN